MRAARIGSSAIQASHGSGPSNTGIATEHQRVTSEGIAHHDPSLTQRSRWTDGRDAVQIHDDTAVACELVVCKVEIVANRTDAHPGACIRNRCSACSSDSWGFKKNKNGLFFSPPAGGSPTHQRRNK